MWLYTRVNALVAPHDVVLNIGCGRGAAADDPAPYRQTLQDLKQRCASVVGLDLGDHGRANPLIHEFRRIVDPSRWPVATASIDLAYADWVVEHVRAPGEFFSECARVIRPGGYLCIRTPNVLGYPYLVAKIVPNRLHGWLSSVAQGGAVYRDDMFPTVYAANTKTRLASELRRAGFDPCVLRYQPEPPYMAVSTVSYRIASLLLPLFPGPLKLQLMAFARR